MTVDEAINQVMTCASDVHCKREEACFVLAQHAKSQLERERTAMAMAHGEREDQGTVAHYAPSWEISGIDWSEK